MNPEEQLLAAIEEQNSSLVFKILKNNQIALDGDLGTELLLKAVEAGNVSVIRLLVENGAYVLDGNEDDWSPFELAVHLDKKEVVDYFLSLGADEESIANTFVLLGKSDHIFYNLLARINNFNTKFGDLGFTILMALAKWVDNYPENGALAINRIKKLTDMGADPNIRDNEGRLAEDYVEFPEIKLMLRAGAASPKVLQPNQYDRIPPAPASFNQHHNPRTDQPNSSEESMGCFLGVICFFVPLIGLVLYITWRDSRPKMANGAGIRALIGFGLVVVWMIFTLSYGL